MSLDSGLIGLVFWLPVA